MTIARQRAVARRRPLGQPGSRGPGRSRPRPPPRPTGRRRRRPPSSSCPDVNIYYGDEAGRPRRQPATSPRTSVTAFIGPSGCGKSTILRCFNRMNDLIPGARVEGQVHARRRGPDGPDVAAGRGPATGRPGLPAPEPVPDVDLRQRRLRPAPARRQGQGAARRDRRASPPPGGALGRGQGRLPQEVGPRRSRAASSSGCASPGPWRPSPRSS